MLTQPSSLDHTRLFKFISESSSQAKISGIHTVPPRIYSQWVHLSLVVLSIRFGQLSRYDIGDRPLQKLPWQGGNLSSDNRCGYVTPNAFHVSTREIPFLQAGNQGISQQSTYKSSVHNLRSRNTLISIAILSETTEHVLTSHRIQIQ